AARAWLAAEEFDDDGACQLRRVIRSEGASRAWINGRPATLGQLQALCARLIEIHGQHEHQALLDRASQLALLDAYGNHRAALEPVSTLATQWRSLDARMRALDSGTDHAERIALLDHEVAELERHALTPEDVETLNETHRRLANAGQLIQGTSALAELLDGDSEFALSRLAARAQGEALRLGGVDSELAKVGEILDGAQIQIAEAGAALTRYRDALDLDPQRLAEVDAQIARLHDLGRKHRRPPQALLAHAATLRDELESLRGAGESLASLAKERQTCERDYATAAARLSALRGATALRLGGDLGGLLGELGMAGGRFAAQLERAEKTTPDALGVERVEFLVSANPGQPLRALRKVASGGELSRISLAIEVAALGLDEVGTMVFDEVDAGIGGAIAEVVGQKLRRLGDERQVLCVTHLAQVAAQGHQHLRVAKSTDGKSTQTGIEALAGTPRRDEIARMLGGIEITRETLAHARQMLSAATAGR
ncbi:MAG: DNA repair protein RecN, partial [Rudaea sp.]